MHTNQTVNYGLSQFIGTDIPNPLTDYNGDMVKIDTAIKNVADASTDDRDDIAALKVQNGSETLDTTAQTLSGAVNELNTEYGDVNTRLTTAEGKITADEGTLATVVGNVSTLAGKVGAVETKVGTAVLTTTAPDLSGAVNELDADIATEDGKIVALQNQNGSEVLQTTAQTLSGAINELYNAPASGVDADDVSYDNTSSGLTATDVQGAIDELKGDIDDISLEASNVSYDNTASGLTASTVQGAIDEVAQNSNAWTEEAVSVAVSSSLATIKTFTTVPKEVVVFAKQSVGNADIVIPLYIPDNTTDNFRNTYFSTDSSFNYLINISVEYNASTKILSIKWEHGTNVTFTLTANKIMFR